jgi:hypothetical protein
MAAVSRDKSVRRSAQDDVFVGVLKKTIQNKLELMGTASWAKFSRPLFDRLRAGSTGLGTPSKTSAA